MLIGVFDSGIGGLTVLAALRRRFTSAEFIYLGDTANVPYGTKSPAQIRKLSVACARQLKRRGVDALVVACNTASSLALPEIRRAMKPVPVFGVLEPGVEAVRRALDELSGKRRGTTPETAPVLVLATRATVRSHAYGKALREALPGGADRIRETACPLLVPMIEEGWIDHPVLQATLREYVAVQRRSGKPGVALLGCTHYPWIQREVERALPGWIVVNSARAVADSLAQTMESDIVPRNSRRPRVGKVREWIFTDPEALPPFIWQLIEETRRARRPKKVTRA